MSRFSLFLKAVLVFAFLVFPLQSFSESDDGDGEEGDEGCEEMLSPISLAFAGELKDVAINKYGPLCTSDAEKEGKEGLKSENCKILNCLKTSDISAFPGVKKSKSLIDGIPDYDNDQKNSSSQKAIQSAEFATGPSGSSMSDALTAEERERLRMQEIIRRCGRSNPTCLEQVNREWRNGVSNYDRNREQIRDNVRNAQRTPAVAPAPQNNSNPCESMRRQGTWQAYLECINGRQGH